MNKKNKEKIEKKQKRIALLVGKIIVTEMSKIDKERVKEYVVKKKKPKKKRLRKKNNGKKKQE